MKTNENRIAALEAENTIIKKALIDLGVNPEVFLGTGTDDELLASGKGYEAFNVGDTAVLTFFGKPVNFTVVHKDYMTDGKLTLMAEDIHLFHPYGKNNNYAESELRDFLNRVVLQGFTPEVQKAIVTSPVEYYDGENYQTVNDKIWAPSYKEMGFSGSSYASYEGSPLDYFQDDVDRVKRFCDDERWYRLRTPYSNDDTFAWYVRADGSADFYGCSNGYGVVPAFEI